MNCNKNSTTEIDDDLKFIPLNIKEPFLSKDSKWIPLININSASIDKITNNFIIGFSPNTFSNNFDNGLLNIPNIEILPYTTPNDNNNNNNNNNNNSINDLTNNIDESLEYPSEVSSEDLYSYNSMNPPCNIEKDDPSISIDPLHMNLLRNFDFSLDENFSVLRSEYDEKIEKIFYLINKQHNFIVESLKAYKIPIPISDLFVKNIIKLSLNYSKKE